MATVNILQPAFSTTWAENGTVEAIDEAQWKAGWAFVGAMPPSVEQFNKVHQVHDEKSNWLYQQMLSVFTAAGEAPTVGDLNSLRDSIQANLAASFTGLNAVNGWRRLPDGLIIQWGGGTISGNSVNNDVAMPTSFPVQAFVALISLQLDPGNFSVGVNILNNSTLRMKSTAAFQTLISWIAIGR